MDFLNLRTVVVGSVGLVFFRHLQRAIKVFSPVRGERPAPRIQLFPLAAVIIFYQAFRAMLNPWLVAPGLLGFAASLALFEWSCRTIRGHFFSYAYSRDQPQFLLAAGPYKYIRNPFYTSYLLAYLGAAIMMPGAITFGVFAVMAWALTSAARLEERKFSNSPLAEKYQEYRQRTGRFVPKL